MNKMIFNGVLTVMLLVAAGCATEKPMPGSDRDAHGCIGSAGYSWCEARQACYRPWEEPCVEGRVINAVYKCDNGMGEIKVDYYVKGFASIEALGNRHLLTQAVSASGARYEGKGIMIWDKAENAAFELDGKKCNCRVIEK